jgi:hypothetical protein
MGGIGGQIEGLDIKRSAFAMGQGSGAIHDVKSSREIIQEMIAQAEEVVAKLAKLTKVRVGA